ncbi:MAG: amidohydrolase family protein [Steroidobacteraceae bacterium]
MRKLLRSTAAMLLALATLLPAAAAAAATPERFAVLANGEQIGFLEVVRRGAAVDLDYRIDDNGRGPKVRESLQFDPEGRLLDWRIRGKANIGAPIEERYRLRGTRATWKSLNDAGAADNDGRAMYVASGASPWAYGLYLRHLLRQPGLTANALPGGALRAEKLRDVEVGRGDLARTVGAYALWGIDTAPKLVLATREGDLFGVIDPRSVLLREGYEGEFDALSKLAATLSRDYLEGLTTRLVHRYDRPIHVRNVRVFDSRTGQLGDLQTVVVYRDRIAGVRADVAPDSDAVVVDGEGGTLLPGLTDMHSHVSDWDMPLYLAGGVTSVRDLGNDNGMLQDLMTRTIAGTTMGPRVTPSGFLEGKSPFSANFGFVVDTLPTALEKVRWYADHGYWGIKVYSSMTPDWVQPIAAEAHRLGMRVSGHVPAFMTSSRAVRDGYDEINHMNQVLLSFVLSADEDTRTPLRFTAVGERMAKLDLASEPVQRFVALLKERGTTLDVTMGGLEWMLLSQPGQSPPAIEGWLPNMPGPVQRARRTAVLDFGPGLAPTYRASWEKLLAALKMFYDAGVPIVPGTDDVPGFMLHSELEVWGRAGIPNERVLQIATLDCARYLGRDQDLGSIERGKLADFMLLAGDPTKDLGALRQVRMVVKNGDVVFPEEVYSAMGIRPFGRKPPVQLPAGVAPAGRE